MCLTTDGSDSEPYPEANDESLGSFLQTWRPSGLSGHDGHGKLSVRRTLARAVHFMGPLGADVELDARETAKASKAGWRWVT